MSCNQQHKQSWRLYTSWPERRCTLGSFWKKWDTNRPPTPLQTDNFMAEAVINDKIQPKRTKEMDIRFHWLRDRECQEQGRGSFFPIKRFHHSTKQRISPQHSPHNKTCNVIVNRSIIGGIIHYGPGRLYTS